MLRSGNAECIAARLVLAKGRTAWNTSGIVSLS
jgi:hypothetical protein